MASVGKYYYLVYFNVWYQSRLNPSGINLFWGWYRFVCLFTISFVLIRFLLFENKEKKLNLFAWDLGGIPNLHRSCRWHQLHSVIEPETRHHTHQNNIATYCLTNPLPCSRLIIIPNHHHLAAAWNHLPAEHINSSADPHARSHSHPNPWTQSAPCRCN